MDFFIINYLSNIFLKNLVKINEKLINLKKNNNLFIFKFTILIFVFIIFLLVLFVIN